MRWILTAIALLIATPTLAQEAPPGPKFGGCLAKHPTTCFGPTVSVNVLSISLRDATVTTQFSPGIGYGVVFNSDKWNRVGLSFNLALKGTSNGTKPQPSILVSFAEYVRVGLSSLIGAGDFRDNSAVLFSFGSDFGSSQ